MSSDRAGDPIVPNVRLRSCHGSNHGSGFRSLPNFLSRASIVGLRKDCVISAPFHIFFWRAHRPPPQGLYSHTRVDSREHLYSNPDRCSSPSSSWLHSALTTNRLAINVLGVEIASSFGQATASSKPRRQWHHRLPRRLTIKLGANVGPIRDRPRSRRRSSASIASRTARSPAHTAGE
ncbi:hypothetical protein ACP70R_007539 [Stipagrostis hirtigluma subsp. patula]